MIRFYKGLKDNVKDNFYRKDILDIFVEYIRCAIRIDDCLYIRYIEKRGQRLSILR